jgi:uncharacterized membrane protein YfcA
MIVFLIQIALVVAALVLVAAWFQAWRKVSAPKSPSAEAVGVGAVTNFFDTLGIGSFAPTTSWIKFRQAVPDAEIPGTLNLGHALPTITQALVFIAIVAVSPVLLVCCIVAAVIGALLGARIVSRLPVRAIRIGMGVALLVAAGLFAAANLGLAPGGGAATNLEGTRFVVAVVLHLLLGALMTLGIGLYAPSLIFLSLLGLDPKAAFPIMMGACAFLMPAGSLEFMRSQKVSHRFALGLALGGIPAVLVAAFVVKSLPLETLRWGVVVVVVIAAAQMLRSAVRATAP